MESILEFADCNFKYLLILFNFVTILVIYMHNRRNKPAKRHHVLLVGAHPDDESMFFRPTILSLKQDYYVHLLCLSNGGSQERVKELAAACENLGIYKFQCVQDSQLQDGQDSNWSHAAIRKHVLKYVRDNSVRAIFTFDHHGVSGHTNHIAIYNALNSLKSKLPEQQIAKKLKQSPEQIPANIKMYSLESVNFLRKYSGFLDIFVALVKDYSWVNFNLLDAWNNMSLHQSQFVWFRKMWVLTSRYNFINTYQRSYISTSSKDD